MDMMSEIRDKDGESIELKISVLTQRLMTMEVIIQFKSSCSLTGKCKISNGKKRYKE
jgi:hypothetical protein